MQKLLDEIISIYQSNKDVNVIETNKALFREKGNLLDEQDKIAFLDYLAEKGSDVSFRLFCEETHMSLSLEQAKIYSSKIISVLSAFGRVILHKFMQPRLSVFIMSFPNFISEESVSEYYSFALELAIKNDLICTVQDLVAKDKTDKYIKGDISNYESILNDQPDKRVERIIRNYFLSGEIGENWEDYINGSLYVPDIQSEATSNEDYFKTRGKEICKENLKSYKKSKLLSKNTTLEELDAFVDQYNWDDGVEIPYFIMHHKNCDLALRKKLFELGAGDCIDEKTYVDTKKDPWKQFILELKDMIEKEEK
ncbi:MAG: DUF4274 domain-containing protein [Clostridiales bacterium]|nr:DUF4274 domain-containing protein [Clostridiales bacterium]